MEMAWLQDFLTLAETRNFSRAAEQRHVSQSAFSRRISRLEQWLGTGLVDRSGFPLRLTAEGEEFCVTAAEILRQAVDARAVLQGRQTPREDHVRVAVPYALATSILPRWWAEWVSRLSISAEFVQSNVHDLADALVSGAVDLMLCYQSALQPVLVDDPRIEALDIGTDRLRPFASSSLVVANRFAWPGTVARPVPLLTYSPGVYFARLVDLAIEGAPERLIGRRFVTSDMADVLCEMARAGLGVAWLPEQTVAMNAAGLRPVGGSGWTIPLAITAYRLKGEASRSSARLWKELVRRHRSASAHGDPDPEPLQAPPLSRTVSIPA